LNSVTINDVAALAGVSIKTVSRVLNREPHVRDELRARVLAAAETLNYHPNFAARALAGSRAYLIGLYYDQSSLGYISGVQHGAMSACREAGRHLLIEQIQEQDVAGREQIETLLANVKIDGVILPPPVCDRLDVLQVLDQRGTPHVRIAPAGQFDRGPYVYMDDQQAAYDMTAHLQALGHRRIGFIRGHADHSVSALRYQGFVQAMQAAGLEVASQWVQPGSFSFRSGAAAAERLLNLSDRPTAVFASNDDMALGVMAVANRIGLTVPDDLSVAGFDDSPIAQVVWPQLTTVRQPVIEMAYEAASMLIQGAQSAPDGPGRLLDFTIIVRGSTGPSPREALG
jgi:LacI family transcriptional regulator